MAEAVIFVGVQGAGKTTFYRERFFETHIRLSLDMLRTRNRLDILLRACLAAGQSLVVDNTNALASERAGYIAAAKAAGFTVVGYYFEAGLREAIARNQKRRDKAPIPVPGVVGTFKRLEPPRVEEGFDRIYTVRLTGEDQFLIEPGDKETLSHP